ncbi:hypothetical protein B7494_g6569 [Chlorociboria aeruginascens]|nr:hypothetical protein B7494_g6569 [Chlorociboria aeruginascens]
MDSEISPDPWSFKAVLDLSHALSAAAFSPVESLPPSAASSSHESISLGDLTKVFEKLGLDYTPSTKSQDGHHSSSSSLSCQGSTPLTSYSNQNSTPLSSADRVEKGFGLSKEVRWKDEEEDGEGTGPSLDNNNQKLNASDSEGSESEVNKTETLLPINRQSRRKTRSGYSYDRMNISDSDFELRKLSRSDFKKAQALSENIRKPILNEPLPFIPRPKQHSHIPLWAPSGTKLDPIIIYPLVPQTAARKRGILINKLTQKFDSEMESPLPRTLEGIHIFVDCSNIVIGFYNALKMSRGIHPHAFVKQPPLSFSTLTFILERGRTVARKILVGSLPPSPEGSRYPDYLSEAGALAYELSILSRVQKYRDPTPPRRRRTGFGNGFGTTSGQSSGSETTFRYPLTWVEQGVDEVLQMKLLESIVDTKTPSTIVLASGDAAEAEYSGGFLKNVERALTKGWKVELVAWKEGLSGAYMNKEFLNRWKGRFQIITLDDFCEELLAIYTEI